MVGDREAVHAQRPDVRDQVGEPVGAVEEGVLAVGVEMDERHGFPTGAVESQESRVESRRSRDISSRCRLLLPRFQLSEHGVQRDTAQLQQDQQVIEEIRRLGRETGAVLRMSRNRPLQPLLRRPSATPVPSPRPAAAPCRSPRAGGRRDQRCRAARRARTWAGASGRGVSAPSDVTSRLKQVGVPS